MANFIVIDSLISLGTQTIIKIIKVYRLTLSVTYIKVEKSNNNNNNINTLKISSESRNFREFFKNRKACLKRIPFSVNQVKKDLQR